jgi:hypothetical protein
MVRRPESVLGRADAIPPKHRIFSQRRQWHDHRPRRRQLKSRTTPVQHQKPFSTPHALHHPRHFLPQLARVDDLHRRFHVDLKINILRPRSRLSAGLLSPSAAADSASHSSFPLKSQPSPVGALLLSLLSLAEPRLGETALQQNCQLNTEHCPESRRAPTGKPYRKTPTPSNCPSAALALT